MGSLFLLYMSTALLAMVILIFGLVRAIAKDEPRYRNALRVRKEVPMRGETLREVAATEPTEIPAQSAPARPSEALITSALEKALQDTALRTTSSAGAKRPAMFLAHPFGDNQGRHGAFDIAEAMSLEMVLRRAESTKNEPEGLGIYGEPYAGSLYEAHSLGRGISPTGDTYKAVRYKYVLDPHVILGLRTKLKKHPRDEESEPEIFVPPEHRKGA